MVFYMKARKGKEIGTELKGILHPLFFFLTFIWVEGGVHVCHSACAVIRRKSIWTLSPSYYHAGLGI